MIKAWLAKFEVLSFSLWLCVYYKKKKSREYTYNWMMKTTQQNWFNIFHSYAWKAKRYEQGDPAMWKSHGQPQQLYAIIPLVIKWIHRFPLLFFHFFLCSFIKTWRYDRLIRNKLPYQQFKIWLERERESFNMLCASLGIRCILFCVIVIYGWWLEYRNFLRT